MIFTIFPLLLCVEWEKSFLPNFQVFNFQNSISHYHSQQWCQIWRFVVILPTFEPLKRHWKLNDDWRLLTFRSRQLFYVLRQAENSRKIAFFGRNSRKKCFDDKFDDFSYFLDDILKNISGITGRRRLNTDRSWRNMLAMARVGRKWPITQEEESRNLNVCNSKSGDVWWKPKPMPTMFMVGGNINGFPPPNGPQKLPSFGRVGGPRVLRWVGKWNSSWINPFFEVIDIT